MMTHDDGSSDETQTQRADFVLVTLITLLVAVFALAVPASG